jgi:hypothetical protein
MSQKHLASTFVTFLVGNLANGQAPSEKTVQSQLQHILVASTTYPVKFAFGVASWRNNHDNLHETPWLISLSCPETEMRCNDSRTTTRHLL